MGGIRGISTVPDREEVDWLAGPLRLVPLPGEDRVQVMLQFDWDENETATFLISFEPLLSDVDRSLILAEMADDSEEDASSSNADDLTESEKKGKLAFLRAEALGIIPEYSLALFIWESVRGQWWIQSLQISDQNGEVIWNHDFDSDVRTLDDIDWDLEGKVDLSMRWLLETPGTVVQAFVERPRDFEDWQELLRNWAKDQPMFRILDL